MPDRPTTTALALADPRRVEQRITPERFVRVVVQALAKNAKLRSSTEESVVLAVMEAAQLGLEPTGVLGMAYLVPYWNKSKKANEAKLMVGYRGYVDLMRRSGELRTIEARVVYTGDHFEAAYGIPQKLQHVPASVLGVEQGQRRFVYWLARLVNGAEAFDILEMPEIENARKSSKAGDDGPWVNWYDRMAAKTAIRRSVATLPVSIVEARYAAHLEDEAENEADVRIEPVGAAKDSRSRAVAMIAGGDEDESAPAEGEESGEAAPGGGPPDSTSESDESRGGAPDASEDGSTEPSPGQEALFGEPDSEDGLPDVPESK